MSEEKTDIKNTEFTNKMKEMGWREIDSSELPEAVKRLKNKGRKITLRECKSEVKLVLDADIVEHFKQASGENGEDYKTLINTALRNLVDSEQTESGKFDEILNDREFLSRLKSELETV